MYRFILSCVAFLLTTQCAFAKTIITPTVMANMLYVKSDSDKFEYVNEYETLTDINYYFKSLNFGLLAKYKNLHITLTTNRFFNNVNERDVRHKQTSIIYQNRQELKNDTLGVGYLLGRFNSAIIISSVNKEDELIYNTSIISKSKKHDIVKGLSFGYYITNRNLASLTLYEQADELSIKYAVSINLFYSFKEIF